MALIKSAKSHRLLRDAVVLDMGDLARQAERIVENARTEAARIAQAAQEQAQRLIEGADVRGHAEGFERGRAAGHAQGLQEGRQQALAQLSDEIKRLEFNWRSALETW